MCLGVVASEVTSPSPCEVQGEQTCTEAAEENELLLEDVEEKISPSSNVQAVSDFRAKYMQKLVCEKVLVPPTQRPPKHQSVIIFDWDDTLLPTSWLQVIGNVPSVAKERVLASIAEASAQLLELAITLGHTFIITNAAKGWVEFSAAKWAPALLPVLAKVQIISARDQHEASFPQEVNKWKIQAFLDVKKRFDSSIITNLVVLGDAEYEMTAASIMGAEFETALVKTIKFREGPTPAELLKQLELVMRQMKNIVVAARKMRVFLERR